MSQRRASRIEQLPPTYAVVYEREARRFLEWLDERDPDTHDRVYEACDALAGNPRPRDAIKMAPKKANKYRLEIRPYRAIYYIDDKCKVVKILDIDHRKQVYR